MAEKKKKRADGRYQVSFRFNGKKYYGYGSTQKEAAQQAETKKRELEKGIYIKAADLTLNQYHERWEQARLDTVKEATIRKQAIEYKAVADVAIDKANTLFGDIKIIDIEPQMIKDLQKILINTSRESGLMKYNTNTVNGIMNLVKHILNDAVKERIIVWNPCCTIKPLTRKEALARDTIHKALSKEETQKFFCNASESWYLNLFKFLLSTGCRIGEACALKWTDIDSSKNVIHIRRTLTKDVNGVYRIGDTTKTKDGRRDIPLTQNIKQAIESQREYQILYNHSLRIDGVIFTSPENNIVNGTCVNREIARICKAAEIRRFTAHAFRDTFATRAIESGVNPKTLQVIMGHSDIKMTMNLYAQVMEDTKVKEMQMIDIAL